MYHHYRHSASSSNARRGYSAHPYKPYTGNYDGERLFSNQNKDPSCSICYNEDTGAHYYHHHNSTQYHRVFAEESSRDGKYFCILCKRSESLQRPARRSVVVSGSTLAGSWTHESFKISSHIDMEVIVGGTVSDGCRAWRRQYSHLPEPCDVVVVLGINNIGAGQSAEEVMEEMREFRDCVKKHSVKFNHAKEGTFASCTVIQPPKHMSFDEAHPYPHLTGGRNKKGVIEEVNKQIIQMNEEMGVWAPRLHIYGMKVNAKSGVHTHHDVAKDYTKVEPAWWKEPELHKRLHFTKVRRAFIAMKLAKHFNEVISNPTSNYGVAPYDANSNKVSIAGSVAQRDAPPVKVAHGSGVSGEKVRGGDNNICVEHADQVNSSPRLVSQEERDIDDFLENC